MISSRNRMIKQPRANNRQILAPPKRKQPLSMQNHAPSMPFPFQTDEKQKLYPPITPSGLSLFSTNKTEEPSEESSRHQIKSRQTVPVSFLNVSAGTSILTAEKTNQFFLFKKRTFHLSFEFLNYAFFFFNRRFLRFRHIVQNINSLSVPVKIE